MLGVEFTFKSVECIPNAKVVKMYRHAVDNKNHYKSVFGLRYQETEGSKVGEIKRGLEIINQVLGVWGFTIVKVGKRNQKRVEGKVVDLSEYSLVANVKHKEDAKKDHMEVFNESIMKVGSFV